jgi:hypothetical protein
VIELGTLAGANAAMLTSCARSSVRAACPLGFECNASGTTTVDAHVASGYWRPLASSSAAFACPLRGTCTGGRTPTNFSLLDASGCRDGFQGPFCTDCVDSDRYVSASASTGALCSPCRDAGQFFATLALVCISVLLLSCCAPTLRACCRMRGASSSLHTPLQLQQPPADTARERTLVGRACMWLWRRLTIAVGQGYRDMSAAGRGLLKLRCMLRLRGAVAATMILTKLKICVSVSLIIAQVCSA